MVPGQGGGGCLGWDDSWTLGVVEWTEGVAGQRAMQLRRRWFFGVTWSYFHNRPREFSGEATVHLFVYIEEWRRGREGEGAGEEGGCSLCVGGGLDTGRFACGSKTDAATSHTGQIEGKGEEGREGLVCVLQMSE
jgi:hypothetical protein